MASFVRKHLPLWRIAIWAPSIALVIVGNAGKMVGWW